MVREDRPRRIVVSGVSRGLKLSKTADFAIALGSNRTHHMTALQLCTLKKAIATIEDIEPADLAVLRKIDRSLEFVTRQAWKRRMAADRRPVTRRTRKAGHV